MFSRNIFQMRVNSSFSCNYCIIFDLTDFFSFFREIDFFSIWLFGLTRNSFSFVKFFWYVNRLNVIQQFWFHIRFCRNPILAQAYSTLVMSGMKLHNVYGKTYVLTVLTTKVFRPIKIVSALFATTSSIYAKSQNGVCRCCTKIRVTNS